ncbi:DUF3221 domain-containing protein [Peribacillus acanthi]|uniref:DUF3221 domain-containing protein n=1 Tax=Peribacillus acanthi TaxID=2171554 RepID=UPI0013005F20|nr:DUF3221 domain-containing protein [Peribacillus acanthi]
MRRNFFIALFIIMFVLSACSNNEKGLKTPTNDIKNEGYIVEKRNKNGFQILVMKNITKEDIEKKSKEELIKQAQDDHTATYFFVQEDEYKKIEVGHKVIVWYTKGQPQMESNPPQTDSKKVEIIEEGK